MLTEKNNKIKNKIQGTGRTGHTAQWMGVTALDITMKCNPKQGEMIHLTTQHIPIALWSNCS